MEYINHVLTSLPLLLKLVVAFCIFIALVVPIELLIEKKLTNRSSLYILMYCSSSSVVAVSIHNPVVELIGFMAMIVLAKKYSKKIIGDNIKIIFKLPKTSK